MMTFFVTFACKCSFLVLVFFLFYVILFYVILCYFYFIIIFFLFFFFFFKDLFIGRQEFVVGYSKAPEQPQSSDRPICHSHAMTRSGGETATIRIAA